MRTPATRIRWTLGVMAGVALCSLSARATQLDQLSTLNVQSTIDAAVWSSGNDIGGTTLVDDSAQIWCSSESNVDPFVKTPCPTGEQPDLLRENEFLRQRIDKEARLQYKEVCFVRLQRSGRYSASSTAWKRAS